MDPRDASTSKKTLSSTYFSRIIFFSTIWSCAEEWMFEKPSSICAKLCTLLHARPWPFEEQTREVATMGLTPASYNVPRTITHRAQLTNGNVAADFYARQGQVSNFTTRGRSYGNGEARFPCSARLQLTDSICRSSHCWVPPKTSHQGWHWDNAGENIINAQRLEDACTLHKNAVPNNTVWKKISLKE